MDETLDVNVVLSSSSSNCDRIIPHFTELDDVSTFIPCDLCDTMVRFSEYEQHASNCTGPVTASPFGINFSFDDDEVGRVNIAIPMHILEGMFGNANSNILDILSHGTIFSPALEIQNDESYEANMLISEIIGNVEVGIPDFESVCVPVDPCDVAQENEPTCPICRENITNEMACKTLCRHLFCKRCLGSWLNKNKTCPMCMQNLADMVSAETEQPS